MTCVTRYTCHVSSGHVWWSTRDCCICKGPAGRVYGRSSSYAGSQLEVPNAPAHRVIFPVSDIGPVPIFFLLFLFRVFLSSGFRLVTCGCICRCAVSSDAQKPLTRGNRLAHNRTLNCMGKEHSSMSPSEIRNRPWPRPSVAGTSLQRTGFDSSQWWTKWHWDRFLCRYFGFPLPVSFHPCSIRIHSSVTYAV